MRASIKIFIVSITIALPIQIQSAIAQTPITAPMATPMPANIAPPANQAGAGTINDANTRYIDRDIENQYIPYNGFNPNRIKPSVPPSSVTPSQQLPQTISAPVGR